MIGWFTSLGAKICHVRSNQGAYKFLPLYCTYTTQRVAAFPKEDRCLYITWRTGDDHIFWGTSVLNPPGQRDSRFNAHNWGIYHHYLFPQEQETQESGSFWDSDTFQRITDLIYLYK